MRMDEMNRLFEEQGFTVERKWENGGYRFTISKDGNYLTERFVYPSGVSSRYASQVQRDFVKDMISRFHRAFPVGEPKFVYKPVPQGRTSHAQDHVMALMDTMILYPDSFVDYSKFDVEMTERMWTQMNPCISNNSEIIPIAQQRLKPRIKDVIFNDPATIVFWSDGTKTVVKCQDDDIFDPEKGLAMAISKKALGNKGNYCNELKKWLPESESEKEAFLYDIKLPDASKLSDAVKALRNFGKTVKEMNKKTAVRKAYDALVKARDGDIDYSTLLHPIEEAIGYLGEALED